MPAAAHSQTHQASRQAYLLRGADDAAADGPAVDCVLLGAPLELKKSDDKATLPSKFSGVAYSGGFVPDYEVVLDLATTTYKPRMPLLDSHMRWSIIGVVEQAATVEGRLTVAGNLFSDMPNSEAERIAQLALRGVPYEMSVGIFAYTREYFPAGKSVTVNGQTFNGPVTVLRNGQVREVSIVTLGADPRTDTKFFNLPKGADSMNLEQLNAKVVELQAQIDGHQPALQAQFAAGAKAERERIQAVEAALLPGHEKVIASLKFDGKSTGADAAMAVLAAERQLRAGAATNLAADTPPAVAPAGAPAVQKTAAQLEAEAAADKGKPVEERCKAKWERDAAVRAEFGSLGEFTAFTRAEEAGAIRVLSGRQAK